MSAQQLEKQQHIKNSAQRNSSPDGEIGRHKRLKISRFNERAGSIPAPGTMYTAA